MFLNENQFILQENSVLLSEAVKYDFWGAFKNFADDHPDIRKIKNELNEASRMARMDGKQLYENQDKVFSVIRKVLQVYFNLGAVVMTILGPFTLFFGWIYVALYRLIVYACEKSEYKSTVKYAEEIIVDLKRIAEDTKDPKKRKEYEDKIKRIEDKIEETSK